VIVAARTCVVVSVTGLVDRFVIVKSSVVPWVVMLNASGETAPASDEVSNPAATIERRIERFNE